MMVHRKGTSCDDLTDCLVDSSPCPNSGVEFQPLHLLRLIPKKYCLGKIKIVMTFSCLRDRTLEKKQLFDYEQARPISGHHSQGMVGAPWKNKQLKGDVQGTGQGKRGCRGRTDLSLISQPQCLTTNFSQLAIQVDPDAEKQSGVTTTVAHLDKQVPIHFIFMRCVFSLTAFIRLHHSHLHRLSSCHFEIKSECFYPLTIIELHVVSVVDIQKNQAQRLARIHLEDR